MARVVWSGCALVRGGSEDSRSVSVRVGQRVECECASVQVALECGLPGAQCAVVAAWLCLQHPCRGDGLLGVLGNASSLLLQGGGLFVCESVESPLRGLTSVGWPCLQHPCRGVWPPWGKHLGKAFSLRIQQGRLRLLESVDLPLRLLRAGVGLFWRRHTPSCQAPRGVHALPLLGGRSVWWRA